MIEKNRINELNGNELKKDESLVQRDSKDFDIKENINNERNSFNKEEEKKLNNESLNNDNDEIIKKKELKEELSSTIDDGGIEELMIMKQALDEKTELLEKVSRERDEFKETLQRLKAEFENFKKRVRKEKEEFSKYAMQRLIEDLLPILDNFDRALEIGVNIEKRTDDNEFKQFFDGVKLIQKSLVDLLEKKYELRSIGKIGENFDPIKHEAITMIEKQGQNGIKIEKVIQKGYYLADRIIRTAKVVVSKGKAEDSTKDNKKNDNNNNDNDNSKSNNK